MLKTGLGCRSPTLLRQFCRKTGLPLTNGYANPFTSNDNNLFDMQKLLEGCFANTLHKIQIPHIDPKTNTTSTSNIFSKIDTIVTDINPDSKVYVYGGVVRSVLSFIYWYLITEHQKNPGNIQTKHILEEFLKKNETYDFQHVLGLGSDLDILIDQNDSLERIETVTLEVKKFIDQHQKTLPPELRSALSLYGDVKNYQHQVPRSTKQGGSPIDWLSFPATPRSGNTFREPQTHPGIVENLLQGRLTFYPVDNSESRPHTVTRIIRTFLDLPFLELNSDSIDLLCKEIKQLPNEKDAKELETFQKGVRNARYYTGFTHPINRFTKTQSDALALTLKNHSQQFQNCKKMPLLPEVLESQNVLERSFDFDPGNLRKDNLLTSFTDFNQNFTNNGYLYHGTNDLLNLLSMFRGTYLVSNESQGTAIYGRGFYCSMSSSVAQTYSENSSTKVLRFKILNSPNIRILEINSIPKEKLENWKLLAEQSGLDLHSYLFEKLSVDIVINEFILIQNMNVISLPNSISQMHSDWIDASLAKWTCWKTENTQPITREGIEDLHSLIKLLLANEHTFLIPDLESKTQQIKEITRHAILKTDSSFFKIEEHLGKTIIKWFENDSELMLHVIEISPGFMTFMGTQLQQIINQDPALKLKLSNILIDHVKRNWLFLKQISKNAPNYETIAMTAVQNNGKALQYVSADTPNYETIAMTAIQKNGESLQYVPVDTPNYETIAMTAIQNNAMALQYVSVDTQNYKDIAIAALQKRWEALICVPLKHPDYETIAITAVQKNWKALKYVPIYTPNYETIAMAAVQKNWEALQYIHYNALNYDEIATIALQQSWAAMEYIDPRTPNYDTIAMNAAKKTTAALTFISCHTKNYTAIAIDAVQRNWKCFRFIPKTAPQYETIKSILLQINPNALNDLSEEFD